MKESTNAIFVMLSLYIFAFTSMYKFTCQELLQIFSFAQEVFHKIELYGSWFVVFLYPHPLGCLIILRILPPCLCRFQLFLLWIGFVCLQDCFITGLGELWNMGDVSSRPGAVSHSLPQNLQ